MRLFKKLKQVVRAISEIGMTSHEIEISRIKHAIKRYEDDLCMMRYDFYNYGDFDDCCIECAVPGYSKLVDKLERVRATLKRLESK